MMYELYEFMIKYRLLYYATFSYSWNNI